MELLLGSYHVALGFNDLGWLLSSKFTESERHKGKALHFGIERSEFNITKSLVLTEMLHSNVGLESVFQVWYSSAWSSNVLPSFRKCCTLALERWEASESSEASRNEVKVTAYLRHWASAEPLV